MRAIVQRVAWAKVTVGNDPVGECGPGLLLLVGVHRNDGQAQADKLADRVAGLRIFEDEQGKMNLPIPTNSDRPQVLAISNFTVYGDALGSRRPSFTESAPFETARSLFDHFVEALRSKGLSVNTGQFGAEMRVESLNDGPVTLVIDVEVSGDSTRSLKL